MLTDTDIHYVVGLLSSIAAPEAIEVELGARVLDNVAGNERDVDVVVSYSTPSVGNTAMLGIEVKAHSRPLDIAHVEQLAAKLNDMPALCSRAIVSASGYTAPAQRKASTKGVELFTLRPWNFRTHLLDDIKFDPSFQCQLRVLDWASSPHVSFETVPAVPLGVAVDQLSPVLLGLPTGVVQPSTLGAVAENVQRQTLAHLKTKEPLTALPDSADLPPQRQRVTLTDQPRLLADGGPYTLTRALVTGRVRWVVPPPPAFYMLARDGEDRPTVACVVTDLPDGGLIGLAFTNKGEVRLMGLPVSDRNRTKIFRQKLKSGDISIR